MFSIAVTIDGAVRKFETAAESAADLEKPLRIFMARLRRRAIERYKAQAFAPLAESTLEKRFQKGLRIIEHKLERDLRRALGRARKARGRKGLLQRLIEGSAGKLMEDVLSAQTRGVQNRMAVLAEFQRWNPQSNKKNRLMVAAGGRELTMKQRQGLATRTVRQVQSTANRPILGGLPNTLKVEASGDSGKLTSATREEWSEVHNKGGVAGHGAQEPQRETLTIDESDIEYLVAVLKDHLLLPFEPQMHGPGY